MLAREVMEEKSKPKEKEVSMKVNILLSPFYSICKHPMG
jgi:hypothetical protein